MTAHDRVSVIYLTHRETPRFDWFADSLARQIGDDDVEVIVVDGLYSADRAAAFETLGQGRFRCRAVAAKPTPFNGDHRCTGAEYFAAASARNTGLVYARRPYIVFADDLSVLMPGWWDEVRTGAARGAVVAGAYQKHRGMRVQDGVLVSSTVDVSGLDSRWSSGEDGRWVPLGGGQLFGCSVGAPRALLVDVNGFDELCDPIGGEDYHLGVRLQWAGATLHYSRRMLSIESEELHHTQYIVHRVDKTTSPGTYITSLQRFGVTRRCQPGAWDSSHMVLDITFGIRTPQTLGNYYLLSELEPSALDGLVARFPETHWFDGQPLSEL